MKQKRCVYCTVELTEDIEQAVEGAALWVSAIPTVYLRETLRRVAPAVRGDPPMLSLSKGLEMETFRRPTEILEEVLCVQRVAVLSGPEGGLSAAEEAQALQRGFMPLTLGPRVLRAETAAIAALLTLSG